MDDYEHGTHVAGIIAANWDGVGISGITSGARIMAVKISNDKGTNSLDEAVRGYEYIMEAKKAASFYNNPYAVVVGASDKDGMPTEFSNYGHKSVDVFAPGDWIYSTLPLSKGEPDCNGQYDI